MEVRKELFIRREIGRRLIEQQQKYFPFALLISSRALTLSSYSSFPFHRRLYVLRSDNDGEGSEESRERENMLVEILMSNFCASRIIMIPIEEGSQ